LKRLPKNFESELNNLLLAGCTVTISTKPENIDGGFVLVYDDIEQNCSFSSLLAAQIDAIKDELYAKMFKRDNL
jgi:V/A-type H+-transporting ATPase subunit E